MTTKSCGWTYTMLEWAEQLGECLVAGNYLNFDEMNAANFLDAINP
jgi:hypothetical protein